MATSHKKQNSTKLIYAAIDFGTTYSGYAFSTKDTLDRNPTEISTIAWRSGSTTLQSTKVPTCVLFDSNKEFSAFGYEAENKYTDLAFDRKHKDWYFFRHFKMSLYNKQTYYGGEFTYTRIPWYSHTSTAHNNLPDPSKPNSGFHDIGNKLWVIEIVKANRIGQNYVCERLNRNYTVEDELGKSMPAMDVFRESIRYLKNHLMSTIMERFLGMKDRDVFWVITVPAVWNETAKQFMYEAAIKTGISNEDLVLALEPEVASIFCINTQLERNKDTELSFLKTGSKYMVVDAGGGTVDITVHSVRENRGIDELHSASGGDWGGSYVDEAFGEFLNEIFGKQVMNEFRKENTIDTLDLQRDFECKKRDISLLKESRIQLRLPLSLLDLYKEKHISKSEQTCLESSALHAEVKVVGDKLRIEHSKAKTFFNKASEELLQHLNELFKMEKVQNIDKILMVGGFADSQFLKETIRASFPEKRVIIPDDPGLAVLKGAVIFGHNQTIIKSRMSRYTYGFGVEMYLPYLHFNENNVSQEDTLIDKDGSKCLRNVFDKHVTKCQILEVDKAQSSRGYFSIDGSDFTLSLYISDELDPILVTDPSCHLIGEMGVKVGHLSNTDVRVNLRFGDTKIKVELVKLETGETVQTEFDCLV